MGHAAKSKRRETGKVELMMTPMIDVVFQLLIFLMVLPTGDGDYLPTNLPDQLGPRAAQVGPERPAIRIDLLHVEPYTAETRAVALIRLNHDEVADYGQLRLRLHTARRQIQASGGNIGEAPVLICPDQTIWHRHVVAAFDAAIDAGFKDIRFTVPQ